MLFFSRNILLWFVIATANFHFLFAQAIFNKMQISPLNRVTIFFDDLPSNFNSFLNSDKTMISIIINDASAKVRSDTLTSDGIVKKVEMKKFSNHIELNLYLKSPRGYTITPLEFSRALMVEVFDWNSLSPAEDNYRMGQLSITNNLAVARNYFEKAFEKEIANAGFFLGFLHLKANLPEKALQILGKAEKLGCNIPDNFAALAQTYYLLNDKKNFEQYKAKFLSAQKDVNFKFIEINPELKDSIFKEVTDILETSEIVEKSDTISKKVDTAAPVKPTVIQETPIEPQQEKFSVVEKIFIFLLVSIFVVSVLLLSLYLKWRKEKKLLEIKQKFENELVRQKRKSIPSRLAAETYKKTEEGTKSKETSETPKVNETTLNPEIKNLAEQILDSKRAEIEKQTIEEEKISTKQKKYPPRIQIAMQIQKEQAELIKKKIAQLEITEIPMDFEKLDELAKSLGISKTSLLAKKNIEAIEKNKDIYKNLQEKFFPKKND